MSNSNTKELEAQIAALTAEAKELKAKARSAIRFKVGAKGGLSMYGLGRFPVTLYAAQWERLVDATPQIKEALEANAGDLLREA